MKGKAVFVENEGLTTQLSVDNVKVYRRPSADELPDPEDLPVSPGTDNYRRRLLSPQEASDAWLDFLRDPLQDLFSTQPDENAISSDEFFMDSVVHTAEIIALSDPCCAKYAF